MRWNFSTKPSGDGLRQPRLAHRCGVKWQTDGLVLCPVPIGADGHVQASLAEHVEAGEILGQDRGMAQVVVQHEGTDPKPVRYGSDGRHGRHR